MLWFYSYVNLMMGPYVFGFVINIYTCRHARKLPWRHKSVSTEIESHNHHQTPEQPSIPKTITKLMGTSAEYWRDPVSNRTSINPSWLFKTKLISSSDAYIKDIDAPPLPLNTDDKSVTELPEEVKPTHRSYLPVMANNKVTKEYEEEEEDYSIGSPLPSAQRYEQQPPLEERNLETFRPGIDDDRRLLNSFSPPKDLVFGFKPVIER